MAKYQLQLGYPTSCEPQCYFFADDCQEVECAKLGEFTHDDHAHERQAPAEKQVCRGSEPLISKKSVSWKKAAVFTEVFEWKLNLASASQMTHAFRP